MADINKIGLLLLDPGQTRFLVCEKYADDVTSDYIMPGGQIEENETDKECLVREIREELGAELDKESLVYVGEYVDAAAGLPGKYVSIKLYSGKISGVPRPSSEIKYFHWIGKDGSSKLSPIINNKILPDIIEKGLLS